MDIKLTLGEKLKDERISKKKTIKEVCSEIGISEGILSDYENDKKKPGADALAALASFYNVSVDYLLGLSKVKSLNLTTQSLSKITGLSEEAIETLRTFSKIEDIKSPMIFINSLLEDPKTIYIITLMVNELLYSNDDELTDAERLRMEGGRLWECQKALSELIEKIRREKHGTDN